jgi:hypothetical protein
VLRDDSASVEAKTGACEELRRAGRWAIAGEYDLAALWREPAPLGVAAREALRAIGDLDLASLEMSAPPKPGQARAVAQAVNESINPKTPTPRLIELLHVRDEFTLMVTCLSLTQQGPEAKAALPDLRALLYSPSEKVRDAAVTAMVSIDPSLDRERLTAIGTILAGSRAAVTGALVTLANRAGNPKDVADIAPYLARELLNRSSEARLAAVKILLTLPALDDYTIDALHVIFGLAGAESEREISDDARLKVIRVILHFDAGKLVHNKELETALTDPEIGDAAADLIAQAGPSAGALNDLLLEWTERPNPLRENAMHALSGTLNAATKSDAAVKVVTAAFEDANVAVRVHAAMALAHMGVANSDAIPRITKMLEGTDDAEVAGAARVLAAFGQLAAPALPQAVRALRLRIEKSAGDTEGPAADARAACAELVARLATGSEEHAKLLLLAVQKRDSVSRERLAPPMAKRERPQPLVASLTELARTSTDSLVRINARCALREVGESVPVDAMR